MPDLRNSTALRQLHDLAHDPDPPRWTWAVAHLDRKARITLSAAARSALDAHSDDRTAVRACVTESRWCIALASCSSPPAIPAARSPSVDAVVSCCRPRCARVRTW